MTEKIGKACSLHLKKKWTKISNCYFYHSLPPDQLKYISPINSSICLHQAPSVSEGKDPVLYHSLCSIPFFPLWYLPVFLSFWEWISWPCTGTSGSWVLPLLYTLWNGVFVYLALIPHTSGHPPGVYCFSGPSCLGVVPMWTCHTITELFAFWLWLTYSKVIHLKCRYKCLLKNILVIKQRIISKLDIELMKENNTFICLCCLDTD